MNDLNMLIERARAVQMSQDDKEEQRRSFAFGNTKIENQRITRQTIDRLAEEINNSDKS